MFYNSKSTFFREIIFSDIVGKNGVIHVISSLILPKSAQTVTQEIKQRNGQKFLGRINRMVDR